MASGRKPSLQSFDSKRIKTRMKLDVPHPVKILMRNGEMLASPETIAVTKVDALASVLRQSAPRSERLLWEKIEPIGFVHSVPLFGYVADFYHPKTNICIEVDGAVHFARRQKDRVRDRVLRKHGIRTFRFSAKSVYEDLDRIAMHVKNIITLATPIHQA